MDQAIAKARALRVIVSQPSALRTLREAAGLTQADVGASMGVSGTAVGWWEAGRYRPQGDAPVIDRPASPRRGFEGRRGIMKEPTKMTIARNEPCVNTPPVECSTLTELAEFGALHTQYSPDELILFYRRINDSLILELRDLHRKREIIGQLFLTATNALIEIECSRETEEVPPPDDEEILSPPLSNLLTTFQAALVDREKAA